jgi:translocation and assembly module TamB
MRILIRWLFRILLLLAVIIVVVPAGLVVALNSKSGRGLVVRQVNQRSGGMVHVAGLGGHFPADIKLASVSVADRDGVWLTGSDLELRWAPLALFSRRLHVVALTADTLEVARAPVAGSAPATKKSSGGINLYHFRAVVDRLAIRQLGVGAALAGRPLVLAVSGNAHVESLTHGGADLSAIAADHRGNYQLAASINNQKVDAVLHVREPPDGLLGHYAGPQVHEPFRLDLTLAGPRDAAALNFGAALGAAALNGAGVLSLDPDAPKADVVLSVPALAPIAALAGEKIGGSTRLHLVVSNKDHVADLALDGVVGLTSRPGPAAKLVGPDGRLSVRLSLADNVVHIQSFGVSGAAFDVTASGQVARSDIDLKTHLDLLDVAAISPGISGHVTDDDVISGTAKDFAVKAVVSGTIKAKQVPSGPFSLDIAVAHLPGAPVGTVQGSGQLENAPLAIDAAFARDASGAASVKIASASWQSLQLQADLALAAGAKLPTGTAKIVIRRLADFAAFAPVPISGSLKADFAHRDAQNFVLNVNADSLNVSPALGDINAKVNAQGPLTNLAVRVNATLAKLMGAPVTLATAGAVNVEQQSVNLRSLSAAWKSLDVNLQGPASIETKPGISVRHLALSVNGGSLALDGRLTPSLDFTLNAANLPANLAQIASPNLAVTGTLSATAKITGSTASPAGNITLNADAIKLHSGAGAAIPAADLAASATFAGKSAKLHARLNAGPEAHLEADGQVPMNQSGTIDLHLAGLTNLQILDPIVAAQGTAIRGVLTPDFTVTGTPAAPIANGTLSLAGGSVQNVGSGLNLTKISAQLDAAGKLITLRNFTATAGAGSITGHGNIDLGQPGLPLDFAFNADNATPVSSDLVTENIDAALTLKGAVKAGLALGGKIEILKADINIPKSLPASVAKLEIYRPGEKPPPPPAPPPNIALNLLIHAHNQIFIRGDGLFAELGGLLTIGGTAANPIPEGGFTLIRGNFALGGKSLQFTNGVVSFNGAGFMPTLDLEATTTTTGNNTATLVVGGTAADPTITLSSSPPLPSDEVLSQLLFGQSTQSLSPFQAASLAAALASLSGIGGSAVSDPLGGVRNALGLDELSLGGGQNGGAPSLQAGRYVAPGVYVGAQQSTSGSGTEATVQVDLYKGLKLQTQTGTSTTGSGQASSVGLTYQFNY